MVARAFEVYVQADEEQDMCYICLQGNEAGELVGPCRCATRFVHRPCLARWQLQSAGRE